MKIGNIVKVILPVLMLSLILVHNPESWAQTSRPMLNLVIDASGSMNGKVEGSKTKMQSAKEAANSVIDSLPSDSRVGLRTYGSEYPESAKNCTDMRQLVPISALDKTRLKNEVNALTAKGWTPIEASLRKAYDDFPSSGEAERVIVLVSDGEETCGGDPCAAAKDLEAKGVKLTVNTIGFSVDTKTREQLKCIANATGGTYSDANNTAELTSGLSKATEKVRDFIDYSTEGEKIVGGSGFDNATKINAGKQYVMDIKSGESLFLYLAAIPENETLKDISLTGYSQNACYINVELTPIKDNRSKIAYGTEITVYNSNPSDSDAVEFIDRNIDLTNYFSTSDGIYLRVDAKENTALGHRGCNELVLLTFKSTTINVNGAKKSSLIADTTSENDDSERATQKSDGATETKSPFALWKIIVGVLGGIVVVVLIILGIKKFGGGGSYKPPQYPPSSGSTPSNQPQQYNYPNPQAQTMAQPTTPAPPQQPSPQTNTPADNSLPPQSAPPYNPRQNQ